MTTNLVLPEPIQEFVSFNKQDSFDDGDRCGVYAALHPAGWVVSDAGDVLTFMRIEAVTPIVTAAGAVMLHGEIVIGKLQSRAVPAAIVQMLALLWRLDLEAGKW